MINVSTPLVCKVIKKLKRWGYLREVYKEINIDGFVIEKKTKPILYVPTDKIYPVDAKLTNFTSGTLNGTADSINDPRLNLICVQYSIIEPPTEDIPGHSWSINNTKYLDYKHEFECGKITFRIINDIKLVIWYPERIVDKRHVRGFTDKIYAKVQPYANWFQKKFHCKLGLPEIYQDYHIAFQENDPILREYTEKHGILKIVDGDGRVLGWWDKSKGSPEFETREERIAEARIFAPFKIIWLEDKFNELDKKIDKIEETIVDKIITIFDERLSSVIEKKVTPIIEEQFNKYFTSHDLPDTFRDVV